MTVKSLFQQKQKKIKNQFSVLYISYSFIIILYFCYLFIYPQKATTATDYSTYFVFNVFLITDLIAKIILSVIALPYSVLKLFGRKRPGLIIAGIIISTGIVFSVLFAVLIGKSQLKVHSIEIEFPNLPSAFDGYKMIQLSDIHLGSFNSSNLLEKTINKIDKLNPDVILFTGDLVNNFSKETNGWKELFLKLKAEDGNYSILGNHDYGDYFSWKDTSRKEENFNLIVEAHKKFGFNLLQNDIAPLIRSRDTIYLVGVENWGHLPFPQYAELEKATSNIPNKAFKILMTHDPAHWESKIKGKENIDLTLSGHTHGLQWGLKPAGIEFSLMYLGRHNWGGLYGTDNQYLYVNRGLGTIGLNFRLDMPAEITLITLKRSKID